MQKVLMILPRRLFPLVSGYSLKNYNLIRILSGRYHVTVIQLSSETFLKEETDFYQTCGVTLIRRPVVKTDRLLGLVSSLFAGRPLQVGLYENVGLLRELRNGKLNGENTDFDVVIAELVRTMPYLEAIQKACGKSSCSQEQQETETSPVYVFEMVDSIGLNYQRSKDEAKSLFLKLYYRFEAGRLLNYERKSIRRSNVTFLFNAEEAAYWKQYGNVVLVPHGVREELLDETMTNTGLETKADSELKTGPYLAFLGKMNYQPNIDAVLWYVQNIHAKLKQRPPLMVIGAYPTEDIKKLSEAWPDITVTGFMEDPYPLLRESLAVIAPMQTGGGIQNKVLEAMALGKPAVVSRLAAKPIVGAEAGRELLTADTPEEYARAYEELLNSKERSEKIGNSARKFIREHYTWESYGKKIISEIEKQRSSEAVSSENKSENQ